MAHWVPSLVKSPGQFKNGENVFSVFVPADTKVGRDAVHALEARIFKDWLNGLDGRFPIEEIQIQHVDFKGTPSVENVLFIRMKVCFRGTYRSQIVELRGKTVVILPVIRCEGVNYIVLVSQARLPSGNYEMLELPAGMVDDSDGSIRGAAMRELQEEVGVQFRSVHLLSDEDILFSPGLLDERASFYLAESSVDKYELERIQGKITGVEGEGERITLKLVPEYEFPWCTNDMKSYAAWALWRN